MYSSMQCLQVLVVLLGLSSLVHAQLNCPQLPARTPPTTIYDLHPNDIKVVMALGDSITAGFGLMGLDGGVEEYRGKSWSIGSDSNATTLFNFLKFYNPALIGGSKGSHVVEICIDPVCPDFQYHPALDVLNAAQSGAMVDDLDKHEFNYLIKQMANNPNIDMQNDWKVLTLLIGANDLCSVCQLAQPYNEPELFETGITAVLETIRTNIPKVFVNIVQMFNISGVYELSLQRTYCVDVHKHFSSECPCIFETNGTSTRPLVDDITQMINSKIFDIEANYKAKNYTDFAVVVQPFGSGTNISSLPIEFISTLDCFHPSLVAHQALATALWNSMLTPAASKKDSINFSDTPICPGPDTLLYTN